MDRGPWLRHERECGASLNVVEPRHLLVKDTGGGCHSQNMQLIAGRTAQEYNRRKNRHGAFWEDRYHATAIQADDHLHQCVVYIDLNMVRAEWSSIRANGNTAGIARFRSRLAVMGISTCWS